MVFVGNEYHSARRDVDNRLYIPEECNPYPHSVHAHNKQIASDNYNSFDRYNSYIQPSTTAHAIQEVLHYRNVFVKRRSLLPVPWCKYFISV
jgi:hypothetical protein